MDNFAIFVMEMKRLLVISYWVVATLLVAIVFTSLGYTFMEAFFIGTLYLPGALAAKYLFTKIVPKDGKSRIRDTVFIVLGILVGEIVLFLMAFYYIELSRNGEYSMWISEMPSIPLIFTNPVFIALILTALAMGAHYFESWLDRKYPEYPGPIRFVSGKRPVTLPLDEILYVESNDSVTTVFATGGRRFRNKTPISKWEANLQPHFIRIHRSYLVNRKAVTGIDVDILYVGNTQLPISRKYKESVKSLTQ